MRFITSEGSVVLTTYTATNSTSSESETFYPRFEADKAFHSYAMKWTPSQVEFYVDARVIRVVRNNIPNIYSGPLQIVFLPNAIGSTNKEGVDWIGAFPPGRVANVQIGGVRYTGGAQCKIVNKW